MLSRSAAEESVVSRTGDIARAPGVRSAIEEQGRPTLRVARRKKPRLIVVANRLPMRRVGQGASARWETSPGGLVAAVEPILRRVGGAWVGWSGAAGRAGRAFQHENVRIKPVGLTTREVEGFYHGMSNRTLWPLYHDAIQPPEFDGRWWREYEEVNRRFAAAAAAVAKKGDLVWVHDYQLQLVPAMLREARPDLRIGFFLHIPFPPEELFAWLPWREQIVRGLLGADVIGFQTHANAVNFARTAREFAGAEGATEALDYEGRTVRAASFPISIDFDAFQEAASSEELIREAHRLRKRLGANRKVILSVDRLDYTKGIEARLLALEALLKSGAVTVDDCVLVQIAVPSRENVREYARLRRRVERTVGRINGDYSMPGRVAVHYFRRSLGREDLIAYYLAADVMLVTPLRDGMNLVAKEYIACRADSSGVLVLSEFAGAARELRRALLVNPRDVEGMARTLKQALTMRRSDARQRMAILRMSVRRHDVFYWAETFLNALAA